MVDHMQKWRRMGQADGFAHPRRPLLPCREVQTLQVQARSEQRVAQSRLYQNLQQDRDHWRAQAEQMKGSLQQEVAKSQGAFRLEQEVQKAVRQSGVAWHTGCPRASWCQRSPPCKSRHSQGIRPASACA